LRFIDAILGNLDLV